MAFCTKSWLMHRLARARGHLPVVARVFVSRSSGKWAKAKGVVAEVAFSRSSHYMVGYLDDEEAASMMVGLAEIVPSARRVEIAARLLRGLDDSAKIEALRGALNGE